VGRATEESLVHIEHRDFGVFFSIAAMIPSKRIRGERRGKPVS
jgi:hypothetical protein